MNLKQDKSQKKSIQQVFMSNRMSLLEKEQKKLVKILEILI